MIKNIAGCALDKMEEIERDLMEKGFIKVGETSNLLNKQYKISSFSGDARSFGDDIKYNIEWCE